MLVVVEGCDRTGKTSLCEKLVRDWGGEILHFGPPEKSAIAEYVEPLLSYVPGKGKNLFVDRHYLGETVWPEFFGRESRMTGAEQLCIELFLRSRGAVCVRTWRDPGDLERACTEEGEPSAGRARVAQLLFTNSTLSSTLHWIQYEHECSDALITSGAILEEERARDELPTYLK